MLALAALATPGRSAAAATSAAAHAPPMSSLMGPRRRLFGWMGASFMYMLPPRQRWLEARQRDTSRRTVGGEGAGHRTSASYNAAGVGRSSGGRRPVGQVAVRDPDRQR